MISIDQMKYFIAIVEHGSLNKASQYLYISQPALTKQLALLEKSLKRSLLLRTPSGMKLTPSGRYFYERSNTIIKMLNETITGVRCFGGKDTIRIGGLSNLITYFMPKYVNKIKHMDYEVFIESMDTNAQLIRGLEDDFFNIVFVSDALQKPELVTIPLLVEPFFLVMKSSNYLSKLEDIDFLTAVKEKLIMYKDPCPIRATIREHCNLMNVSPNIVLELESTESIISYVEQDFGITLLPKMVADSINNPSIVVREIKKFPIHRVISAVLKKEQASSYLPLLL
ncbi:LysR family transcriptional regulator [Clostridium pasteurianum]|uniref:Transcriptional regulator n=1 Tax=Clostridium pasteurianum BC1 TaxID=86416 RepID=R4K9B1_CLOPA|nr:LysR family transcriptional regulator [Clostridium pasteurianum]AGK99143.1 transcriptional regulator [Clostridium pasteurianum BC1]